jgi:hypothetical protein
MGFLPQSATRAFGSLPFTAPIVRGRSGVGATPTENGKGGRETGDEEERENGSVKGPDRINFAHQSLGICSPPPLCKGNCSSANYTQPRAAGKENGLSFLMLV